MDANSTARTIQGGNDMELISREALIEIIEKRIPHMIPNVLGTHDVTAEGMVEFIKSQPTVEAVPVVRCKDCKYFCDGYPNVLNADGLCENTDCLVDLYCFCSYGERKENEIN